MKTPFDTSKLSKDRKDWLEIFGSQWGQRKRTTCCDGCVFGERYQHAEWCEKRRPVDQHNRIPQYVQDVVNAFRSGWACGMCGEPSREPMQDELIICQRCGAHGVKRAA